MLHVGFVVSTVTVLLAVHALFVLFALSLTFHAATANVVLHAAFAVYVNVYLIPFVTVHVTALLLNVTTLLSCVIDPLVKLNVFIHDDVSVHFNVTVHVLYHATNDIGVLLGCTSTLQLGFVVSTTKLFTLNASLLFPAASVTYTLQLLCVHSDNVPNVTVLFVFAVILVVLLLQSHP